MLRDGPIRDSLMLKLINIFRKRIFLRLKIVHSSYISLVDCPSFILVLGEIYFVNLD